MTTHFSGDEGGNVQRLHCVRVGPKPALERVSEQRVLSGRGPGADCDRLFWSGEERSAGTVAAMQFDRRGNLQTKANKLHHLTYRAYFRPETRGVDSLW